MLNDKWECIMPYILYFRIAHQYRMTSERERLEVELVSSKSLKLLRGMLHNKIVVLEAAMEQKQTKKRQKLVKYVIFQSHLLQYDFCLIRWVYDIQIVRV